MNVRVLENKLQGDSLFSVPTLQAALSDMPHNEAAPALLEIAENAEQKRRGVILQGAVLSIVFFVLFLASGISLLVFRLPYKFIWQIIFDVLPYAFLTLLALGYRSTRKIVQKQQNAVAALPLCPQESRFLPHLVDGLHAGKVPEWKTVLYPALTAALWEATDGELALQLDAPRRAALRAFVAYDFPAALFPRSKTQAFPHFDDTTTDLTVAAIRALVAVGDKKTVKVLQRIIGTEGNLRNESVVRDAAREFLPVLQKRIEENEAVFRRLQTLTSDQTENPDAVIAIQTYVDTLPPETVAVVLAD